MAFERGIIQEKLTEYFDQTKEKLIESYERKGLRASGEFARELRSTIQAHGTQIHAVITGPIQSYFMQQGRNPNRDQSLGQVRFLGKILEKWVNDKGISVNPYAAAYKIVHFGIQVPNQHNPGGVISEVINEKWTEELNEKLRAVVITEIKSDVLEQFNK